MFTEKKRTYAESRISGKSMKDSAIAAGCPEKTAAQAATRLEKDVDVIAYKKRIMKESGIEIEEKLPITKEKKSIEDEDTIKKYTDPIDFLTDMMNDSMEEPKLRQDCAKALLPYKHRKLEDVGKKEEKENKAEEVAKGKFGSGKAPALKSVK